MYSINFTVSKKKFCLSLHYNGAKSYLFVNGTKVIDLNKTGTSKECMLYYCWYFKDIRYGL